MNDVTLDAIADERDQAELDAMKAKAETAEWVSAYDRELVRRKAAEARLARVEALRDTARDLAQQHMHGPRPNPSRAGAWAAVVRELDAALSEPTTRSADPEEGTR